MIANVAKWGNSLALRIPSETARALKIAEGGKVELQVKDGTLVVRPMSARQGYDLNELLAGVTPENIHEETDWGPSVGNEF